MKILITSLMQNGNFTLTSLMSFYNIFVWQNANKTEQIDFVTKILIKESTERPIYEIGKTIDLICSKINLDNFSKSLKNFN